MDSKPHLYIKRRGLVDAKCGTPNLKPDRTSRVPSPVTVAAVAAAATNLFKPLVVCVRVWSCYREMKLSLVLRTTHVSRACHMLVVVRAYNTFPSNLYSCLCIAVVSGNTPWQ